MASQDWVSCLTPGPHASGAGASATLSASTFCLSPQTGVSNQDVVVLNAAPFGWNPGLLIRVTARGFYTCSGTTGTLTFSIRANKGNSVAVASNTSLLTHGGITTGASAFTGMQWKLEALLRCTGVAASAVNTVAAQGEISFQGLTSTPGLVASPFALTGAASVAAAFPMPNISGETVTQYDTTQLAGLQLAAQATAAQGTLQCTQWLVEALD
jgi:hypothetical protein